LASVVPPVTQKRRGGRHPCHQRDAGVDRRPHPILPIRLDVDEPLTVGADRIINTLAASRLFQRDTIVVDFGTATTFDCITGDGRIHRRRDHAGVRTAADELVRRTAKLPRPS